jgi:hypothetical protein
MKAHGLATRARPADVNGEQVVSARTISLVGLRDDQRAALAALSVKRGVSPEQLATDAIVAWDRAQGGTAECTACERWLRELCEAGDPTGPDEMRAHFRMYFQAAIDWWLAGKQHAEA